MLLHAVVVAEDGARADVRARAHVAVAEVGEVVGLGAASEAGLLELHEVAHVRALFEHAVGTQMREGTELRARPHLAALHHGVGLQQRSRAEARVVEHAARVDDHVAPHVRAPAEHRVGTDHGPRLEGHVVVDARTRRDAVARATVPIGDALVQHVFDHRELGAVVHTAEREGLPRNVGDVVRARRRREGHEVREVELALRVRRRDASEGVGHERAIDGVEARVHRADRTLRGGAVLVLPDAHDAPVAVVEDASVARGIVGRGGEQRERRARRRPRVGEGPQRRRGNARNIAVRDHHLGHVVVDGGESCAHGVGRSPLLGLHGEANRVAEAGAHGLDHLLASVSHDHHHRVGARVARSLDGPHDQRRPRGRVQHLREGGLHAGALPRGQDHRAASVAHEVSARR